MQDNKNDYNDIPLETRIEWFKESRGYVWPPAEYREEKSKSNRGRKPGPSKRTLSDKPDHYKWWRT